MGVLEFAEMVAGKAVARRAGYRSIPALARAAFTFLRKFVGSTDPSVLALGSSQAFRLGWFGPIDGLPSLISRPSPQ
jgi:hypothetical protein